MSMVLSRCLLKKNYLSLFLVWMLGFLQVTMILATTLENTALGEVNPRDTETVHLNVTVDRLNHAELYHKRKRRSMCEYNTMLHPHRYQPWHKSLLIPGETDTTDQNSTATTRAETSISQITNESIQSIEFHQKTNHKYNFYKDPIGIGHGNTQVYEAFNTRTKEKVAIKIIPKPPHNLLQVKTEINIMQTLRHENLISFREAIETQQYLYIITELCTGGELFDKVKRQGGVSEATARTYLKQIIQGVAYLHRQFLVHRDLKLENIVLVDKTETSSVKIIDFGHTRDLSKNNSTECTGTPIFIPPEIWMQQKITMKVDIWALGVMLYAMLFNRYPWPDWNGTNVPALVSEMTKQTPKANVNFSRTAKGRTVSEEVKDLLRKMLVPNPEQRINISGILKHAWFKKE